MCAYAHKKVGTVVNPVLGTSFDSVEEAYEFYNLYSCKIGFGVRYPKSRLNVHRKKCIQEIVWACGKQWSTHKVKAALNFYVLDFLKKLLQMKRNLCIFLTEIGHKHHFGWANPT